MRRIFISGPSGTGKTTLANILSDYYELGKFISGSSKTLWDKYGIKKHQDIILRTHMDPHWGYEFQNELLDYRLKLFEANKDFNIITDRSPLDNVIYFTLQNSPFESTLSSDAYYLKAYSSFKKGDWLIFRYYTSEVISKAHGIENDGHRITNPFYQLAVQNLMEKELSSLMERGVNVIKFPYIPGDISKEAIERLKNIITNVKG